MNPLRVSASNYRSFERLDVDLPTGCVAVTGANGAGKSSLLNIVDVGLFAERGELASLVAVGEDTMELHVEFEHGGELYRVRRQYRRGKTTVDFEKFVEEHRGEHVWESLSREDAAATQKLIVDTIGLSRATFRASSFLRQGDGAAFTEAQPRDRKQILAEILNLDIWDRLAERVRVEMRGVDAAGATARAKLDIAAVAIATRPTIEATLADLTRETTLANELLAAGETTLETAREAHAANAVHVERLRARQAELAAAAGVRDGAAQELAAVQAADAQRAEQQQRLHQLDLLADKAEPLAQMVDACQARAFAIERRDQLLAEAARRGDARGRLVDQSMTLHDMAADARTKAGQLRTSIDHAGDCDRCGQKLGAEAAERAAVSWCADADQADAKAVELDTQCDDELAAIAELHDQAAAVEIPDAQGDLDKLREQLAGARAAAERRAAVSERMRQLTELVARKPALEKRLVETSAAVDEAQAAVDAAGADVGDEAKLEQDVAAARQTVARQRDEAGRVRDLVARTEEMLARVDTADAEHAQLTTVLNTLDGEAAKLAVCERAYGRNGIPALIVEAQAIPQIEVEANRILAELGTDYQVELRTQRALKTSDVLRESLDIVIQTPQGARPYESFSGGERTRLNLALRIALARLLAHRRGAESRLLAIDEPEFLDEAGVGRLADVLRGLGGDFERVLLVSHHPTLASSFDQAIVVVKDGDRSRIASDDGGAREPVAA